MTVSPDGTSAYVASAAGDAVATFDRNTTSGALTQKPASAGCISETGSAGACADGTALDGANGATVSSDGKSAYVASANSNAVAIFDRNTTTGALTQKPGTAGCISETGTAGACIDGAALDFARLVTVSPNGASAYVASQGSGVAILDREGGSAPSPDITPPELTITKKPKKKVKTRKKRVRVKVKFASEPGAEFECKLDRGIFKPCSSPLTPKLKSARGKGKKHAISIFAYDVAGNSSATAKVKTKVIRRKRGK